VKQRGYLEKKKTYEDNGFRKGTTSLGEGGRVRGQWAVCAIRPGAQGSSPKHSRKVSGRKQGAEATSQKKTVVLGEKCKALH